ncbi:DUF3923 family protein [Fructilactobacillus florum]|uniref:DUF3923 family protein n=1 Tax=Fructilactobacillus florum TaxID=640331 RepID=UPI00054D4748|nr:DUF3923 family protein [Fructilactobacillus florum]
MKKSWQIVSIIELLIFITLSIFIFIRSTDGSGTIQTQEIKLINWCILDIPFAFLFIVQFIWFIVIKKNKK